MMIKKTLILTTLAGLMLTGCDDFECCFPSFIQLDRYNITLEPATSNTEDVVLTSSHPWEVTDKPDWITVDPSAGGDGSMPVSITADVNDTGAQRDGVVTFMAANGGKAKLNVTQKEDAPPPVPIYTVTFNSNGGSAVASQTVNEGDDATKPADPTQTGYVFAGWYEDVDLLTPVTFPHTVTGDITLYAKWTAEVVPTYCIDEDFESWPVDTSPAAAGWTEAFSGSGTRQVMDEGGKKYLRLSGTNSGHCEYYQNLSTPLPEIITIEAEMRPITGVSHDVGSICLTDYNASPRAYIVRLEFANGKINACTAHPGYVGTIYELDTYTLNQWYHVKVVCNLTTLSYQVFIDGVLATSITGGTLRDEFPMLSVVPKNIALISGSCMDFTNIKVYY